MYRTNCFMLCVVVVLVMTALPALAVNQLSFPPTPDGAHRAAADSLLQQIWRAQPGQAKFDAINAVAAIYNQSDKATKDAIAWLCLTYMYDKKRGVLDRWPCEYVLSFVKYELAIPHLIDVLFRDEVEAMRSVAAEALGMWYSSTGNIVIRDALMQSAKTDTSERVRATLAKYIDKVMPGPSQDTSFPPAPDDSHRKAADALLQQIWDAQPGQPKFDAINAVVAKYNQSDKVTKDAIAWLCLTYMYDRSRGVLDRWPCEYMLSYAGYGPAAPHLIYVLHNDGVEAMRAVAAEALGGWYKSTGNTAMRDALIQSAKTDTSQWVRETIARYLGANMPAYNSGSVK